MSAFNIVRFRAQPGQEEAVIEAHRNNPPAYPGLKKMSLVNTGERSFCYIGEWDGMDSIVNARPAMLERLDTLRAMLEDLGDGMGVTDAVSGEALVEHRL